MENIEINKILDQLIFELLPSPALRFYLAV